MEDSLGYRHGESWRLKVGDPLFVRFLEMTPTDIVAQEVWRPATCCVAEGPDASVGAVFNDGTRMMVQRGQWRCG